MLEADPGSGVVWISGYTGLVLCLQPRQMLTIKFGEQQVY